MKTKDNNLALHGGKPVSKTLIPYHRPSLGEKEALAAAAVIRSQMVAGPGKFCRSVENKIEQDWQVPRALTTTSCTHALELALLGCDLKSSDEIIVPSFTYVSSALAIIRAGATPVFADIDPETLMLSPETIEARRTENCRGIVFVHYGGFCGPMQEIIDYCRQKNIFCIEDAAQCFSSTHRQKEAGTFGRFGAFSFHGTKSISCGEGGLLLINNPADIKKCELIRDKGTDRSRSCRGDVDRYTWRETGSSYVLSDILGAVLEKQLERWEKIKEKRLLVQDKIRRTVAKIDHKNCFKAIKPPADTTETGHITAFLLPDGRQRDWLLSALQAEGVQAREHYHPLHLSPYARQHLDPPRSLPVSEKIGNSLIRLPAYPSLTEKQIKQIGQALEKVYPLYLKKQLKAES
ncbi:MAG: DegT/DnrJ/EryC1/StrS family aminotransferase [bacterium]